VLENHHVASSFKLLGKDEYNIFSNYSKDDYKRTRGKMIGCILATDMSKHFSELGKFKSRVNADDYDIAGQDKDPSLHMFFHLADISNPTKPWNICLKWTELLFDEFYV
jgi:hypothetical protein